jgi:zinc protease
MVIAGSEFPLRWTARRVPLLAAFGTLVLLGAAVPARAAEPVPAASTPTGASASLAIPHTTEVLDNGLRVIYHRDPSIPTVVVNVSYNVGSRYEVQGRTGFAHLFEHLMFMGTARAPTRMFDAWMEQGGGWNNAWTSADRTDYFDIGPTSSLPLLLWLEADRMGTLGASMTEEKLNTQRDIVRNERRQNYENEPFGLADLKLTELLFPPGHPYHHPVIGSHADLEAATVADVRAFFAKWYVPSNASLVVAGDFDLTPTRALVRQYFGALAKAPVPADPYQSANDLRVDLAQPPVQPTRVRMTDNVEHTRVTLAWRSADQFAPGDAELDLAAMLLGDGESSRLHRQMVLVDKTAQAVNVRQDSARHGSSFRIEVELRPDVSADRAIATTMVALQALAATPPTTAELQRAQAKYLTVFYTRMQSVRERASLLNAYQAALGTPDYVARDMARYQAVTAAGIQGAIKAVLAAPQVVLEVVPKPKSAGVAAASAGVK